MIRSDFTEYIAVIAGILCLSEWTLEVDDCSPSDSDAIAAIAPCRGRKIAWIRLSDGFLNDDPESQRHTIAHELLHCHFAMITHIAEDQIKDHRAWSLAMEYAVDGIADAIAPLLPLPTEHLPKD